MILIADSGSTKTDWILTDENKNQTHYSTIGYNPYFTDSESIYNNLYLKLVPQLDALVIKIVFFYGAGCSTSEKAAVVYSALSKCFPNSEIFVKHDLLGAARALLGNNRGFAAIIGTGSNTCVYDGMEIEKNIDSLGYLLGDEGSGCYIGKKIVRDFMRDYLPEELRNKFNQSYQYSHRDIFEAIYNQLYPNRFLAGFCKFADENKDHEYIKKIVKESFEDFFKNLVSKYPEYEKFKFNCVGSVGFIFQDILEEVVKSYNMEMGLLINSPIEKLVSYHLNYHWHTKVD
jgi:glucosamine kinase